MTKFWKHRPCHLVGYVDHVDNKMIRGWVWNSSAPYDRIQVDVFYRGVFLGQTNTGIFRIDLRDDHKLSDGYHGFLFHVPIEVQHTIKDASNILIMTSGPIRMALNNTASRQSEIAELEQPNDIPTFFTPFLNSISEKRKEEELNSILAFRPKIDEKSMSSGKGKPSAFVEHIAKKFGRNALKDDPEDFWHWYIAHYSMENGFNRVLLSTADLDILGQICDDRDVFALSLFKYNKPKTKSLKKSHYWWAFEESSRLFVEDCLVKIDSIDTLRQVQPFFFLQSFPIPLSMRMIRARNRILCDFSLRTSVDRQILYAVVMLLALRRPYYLAYIPGRWLRRMLDDINKSSPFESALVKLFGQTYGLTGARYKRLVQNAGFNIESQTFSGSNYYGHRVRGGASVVEGIPKFDVQLIGPFNRTLGLSESCHRVARALQYTRYSVNLVDYDIGHAKESTCANLQIGKLSSARVNILHLNAEELPEAIAYLPDVFSNAYTVVIPYWELNNLSSVHQLGIMLVDEIWTASNYITKIFESTGLPVHTIGMCVDELPLSLTADGNDLLKKYNCKADNFLFLTIVDALSWAERKNTLGVIYAFKAAFGQNDSVKLIIKTRNREKFKPTSDHDMWKMISLASEGDTRIVFIDENIQSSEQRSLLVSCDCLVSLHRAEGLGLDILDALHLGTPVIATAYSGNMDFCNEGTAWLVDFDLVAVHPNQYPYVEPGHVWAEPKLASAISAMMGVYSDQARRTARVRSAHELVAAVASSAAFARRLENRLNALLITNPAEVSPGADVPRNDTINN